MKRISCSLILVFLLLGCKEKFLVSPADTNGLVVNGFFTYGDSCWFNVSYLESAFGIDSNNYSNDAVLTITEPDGTIHTTSYPDYSPWTENPNFYNKGYYRLEKPLTYQPGIYKLTVEVPGENHLTASDSIPSPVKINSGSMGFDNNDNLIFFIDLTDPVSSENFYAVSIFRSIYFKNTDTINPEPEYIQSPNSFTFLITKSGYYGVFFSDETFNGQNKNVEIIVPHGGEIRTNLLAKENNTYYLKPEDIYQDSIVFTLKLYSISKSYFNYANSYNDQTKAEQDFYADPVVVFSNINGGKGIFAGYSTSTTSFAFRKKSYP